jgi:hypothetical protein
MLLAPPLLAQSGAGVPLSPGRDAAQAGDEEYNRKIRVRPGSALPFGRGIVPGTQN